MINVPDSWRVDLLGNLLEQQTNKRFLQQGWSPRCHPRPAVNDETWAVVKTTAIQAGWFDQSQNKELPIELSPRPAIEIHAGDLLMTCAGPRSRCGVPTLVRATRPKLMMSGKMYRFRPREEVDAHFLELWLLTPAAQARIDSMKTGISDSGLNLTQDRFLKLPVPVPDLREQCRIVEILEDQLSRLAAAAVYVSAANRRRVAWARARADVLLWGGGWPTSSVSELIREPMRNGRSDRAAPDGMGGIRTLTLTAVTSGHFTDKNTKLTITDPAKAKNLWLEAGDIFVQRSNTPELVGTTQRYSGPERWAIYPDLLIRVRADDHVIDSRLLAAGLRSERAHRSLRAKAKGLASSMPKIDQAAVGETRVPRPPRDRQEGLIAQLEDVVATEAALHAELEVARVRGEALRRAVLTAAFSGKLTGSSADDEIVEALAVNA